MFQGNRMSPATSATLQTVDMQRPSLEEFLSTMAQPAQSSLSTGSGFHSEPAHRAPQPEDLEAMDTEDNDHDALHLDLF
eukprot:8464944-Karenia_brevis.AAC.1